jgi:ATP-dependent helicase/nuclease subunit B
VLAVECKIGGGDIAPLRIPMDDHRALRIYGKIDRIDRCVEGDQTYFRIIDYKTGKTEFSFGAVKYGEKLQMLLYEMAVSAGGKGGFADMVPAGVLYYPARREPFAADKWLDPQALELKKRREFCMNGILIDDAETLLRVRAMEEKLQQYYIPIEDTGRELKTDSLRSPKEYQNITSYVKNQVQKMARELSGGGITPCYLTDTSPCSHCHYQGLCGKDVRIASRIPERVSEQEARDEILGTED